jgi:hypothetical protein
MRKKNSKYLLFFALTKKRVKRAKIFILVYNNENKEKRIVQVVFLCVYTGCRGFAPISNGLKTLPLFKKIQGVATISKIIGFGISEE